MKQKIHPVVIVVGPLAAIAGFMLMGRSFTDSLIPAGFTALALWWFYQRKSK